MAKSFSFLKGRSQLYTYCPFRFQDGICLIYGVVPIVKANLSFSVKEGVHTKSKIIIGLLAFLLVSTAAASLIDLSIGTVSADTSGDFQYTLINSGTAVKITDYTGLGGSVTIPNSIAGHPVTMIGDSAFSQTTHLTAVTIPSSVTSIGNLSFYGDSDLTIITIPSTVTYIGSEAFSRCPSLAIGVADSNPDFAGSNGVLYNKNMSTLVACPSAAGVFAVADGTKTIGAYAFDGVAANSVTIPNSVTTIGIYAFYACTKLTSVTIGSGVTTIGGGAFEFCSVLTNMAFYGLTSPTNVGDAWIYGTHNLLGHAYAASNFPAPGLVWAGLTMGSYISTTSVAPGAPTGLVAMGGPNFIFLNWTAPANVGTPPLTQFAIYRGTSSGGYGSPLSSFDSNTATFNDTAATPGTQYFYVLKAVNAAGSSPPSNEATAEATTSAQSVPGAPTDLQAVGYSGYIILTWVAPVNPGNPVFTEYHIWRGATAGSLTILVYENAGTLTYNDTSVQNGQAYVYMVKAFNTVGLSLASNEATAAAGTGTSTAPSAPQSFTATPGPGKITLTWSAPASNGGAVITGYKIYRSTGGGVATQIGTTGSDTLTYQDTTGTVGTTYSYYVVAVNSVGSGAASSSQSAAPESGGGTPAGSDNGALLAGIGILVVIILVGLFMFMRGRKRKP
jgi:fibronectin type 3 domain-containing protein